MKTCIICRLPKEKFNDEHVIPEAIKGYYHIYSVCVECNSKLGNNIDNKLTNHKFIEFERNLLKIKGKKGNIPDPLLGTFVLRDNPSQKVRVELDKEGNYVCRLIPKITDLGNKFHIAIDRKDEKIKDEIINKFLYRNKISRENIKITETINSHDPWIESTIEFDAYKFKLGLLKIAYEFAVDNLHEYFEDESAVSISKTLLNADADGLNKIKMTGTGLEKDTFIAFEHLIDFDNKNHYLILFDVDGVGLVCFVRIFNTFSIGILMSEKSGYLKDDIIICKNDIDNHNYKIYNMFEVLKEIYTPNNYSFLYQFDNQTEQHEFYENEANPMFSFYEQDGKWPFFDRDGNVIYDDINTKLMQKETIKILKGDTKNSMINDFYIEDEELYIKLLPINKLYRIVGVRTEQHRISRI